MPDDPLVTPVFKRRRYPARTSPPQAHGEVLQGPPSRISRWTAAHTVRQAADMSCVPRSILLVLGFTLGGVASADSRPGAAAPIPGVKTIIVVRHAEAEHQPGGDPSLTPDGRSRALELARVLGDTPLTSVYATHYQRGRQTAAALPRHAGDKPTVIDDVPGTLAALRAEPWGATALVIGHSNTVPDLVRGLTGSALPEAEPIVFDRMWIVTLARDGTASLLRLHYGAPISAAVTR
jgi:broad specificity phosphatase PhoE